MGLPPQLAFFVHAGASQDHVQALNSAKLGENYGGRQDGRKVSPSINHYFAPPAWPVTIPTGSAATKIQEPPTANYITKL